MAPDRETILDVYEIMYPGLAAPLVLYVNLYLEAPLQAPRGLTCATPLAGG
jgi:hypothetical protein